MLTQKQNAPTLRVIVVMEQPISDALIKKGSDVGIEVIGFDDLEEIGRELDDIAREPAMVRSFTWIYGIF